MSQEIVTYTISNGDIRVWLDGSIWLKAVDPNYGDPLDIADEEAFELVERLLTLVRLQTSRNPSTGNPEHLGVWYDGCICIKAITPADGPIALSGESAVNLAERILMLIRTQGRNAVAAD
jgi:hypothetical protein